MQIVVQDLLTSYDLRGRGKVILLLHGWGNSLQSYDLIATNLAQEYQVLRLDLPGFGQTQAPREA